MARAWVHDRTTERGFAEKVAAAKGRTPPRRWQVRWYDPDGRIRSELRAKKPEAEALRDRLAIELERGTYRDPKAAKDSVATVAEEWWIAKRPRWQPRTRRHNREILDGYVLPRWGAVAVGAVSYGDVATWLSGLHDRPGMTGSDKRRVGPSRIQGIYQVMRGIMAWAVKGRRIAENPVAGLDTLPEVPRAKRLYLDHRQIDALVAEVASLTDGRTGRRRAGVEVYRVLVLTLAYCGLRIGEAAALRAGSVDLEAAELHVVEALGEDEDGRPTVGLPKGGKIRVVGIPDFLVAELQAIKSGRGDQDLIFPAPKGDMISVYNFRQRIFRPAVAEAKLPKAVTPHTLRHSFASLSVAEGCDVKTLQATMGHATAAMTLDVYSDLYPARIGEVADALGQARKRALAT